tara:strand:+ start:12139 stop:13092 length:954 start_codon:yes stop_codon:yes gene_type:complete
MKNIIFLSQKGFFGKVDRKTTTHLPVDSAQQTILQADNCHYSQINKINKRYDVCILLIPKTEQDRNSLYNLDIVAEGRKIADKVWFMQEGPAWIFQDLPLHQQFWHYNVLVEVDGILCENKTDIPYFRGLVDGDKPIWDIPSVMVEDHIKGALNTIKEEKVIIGGNFCKWYGGFDSYIAAHEFNCPIFAPSMGRKIENEEQIENLTHFPYMEWGTWIKTLSSFKYAIHLMPTIAAGTFAMNCGYLGIPCIGYNQADTQRIIHPDLSINLGDLDKARKLAKKLRNDKDFYVYCSKTSQENYNTFFSELSFLKHMNKIL